MQVYTGSPAAPAAAVEPSYPDPATACERKRRRYGVRCVSVCVRYDNTTTTTTTVDRELLSDYRKAAGAVRNKSRNTGEGKAIGTWAAGNMISDEQDEALVLRGLAYRMSLGVEIKTRKHGLRSFPNVFLGTVSDEPLRAIWQGEREGMFDELYLVQSVGPQTNVTATAIRFGGLYLCHTLC